MAARAVNGGVILRSASSPPLAVFRSCFRHFRTVHNRKGSPLGFCFSTFGLHRQWCFYGRVGNIRSYSLRSLVDSVLQEFESMRKRGRVRVSKKLASSGELREDKLEQQKLQQGLLVEFKKDAGRVLLAVAQKPDGKKNWIVFDQNGVSSSIKPQQITYIVPGVEDFDPTEISDFIQRARSNIAGVCMD